MTDTDLLNLLDNEYEEPMMEEDGIIYYLYTQNNPNTPQILKLDDLRGLAESFFITNYNTKVIVHGWLGDTNSVLTKLIEPLVFENGIWNNVIFVDWSKYALTYNYAGARLKVPKVGRQLAKFLDQLHKFAGMSFNKLTVIGHSLGTHVVGFAGKHVKLGRINTIYGLDPTDVLFSSSKPHQRLNSTDAKYVETIHTNGQWLGFLHPIGQAAFYPNWGKLQPGCEKDLSGYCSHARCVDFFVEAINLGKQNQFYSTECATYDDIKKKQGCNAMSYGVKMFDPLNHGKVAGIFYLSTNSIAPWGKGVSTKMY